MIEILEHLKQGSHLPSIKGFLPPKFVIYPPKFMNLLIKAYILGVQNSENGASIPLISEVSGKPEFTVDATWVLPIRETINYSPFAGTAVD